MLAQSWQMYLLLLLPIAYLIIFKYWPMYGVQIAFRKYKVKSGISGSEWVGLYQFSKFFSSFYFNRVVGNTLRLSLYGILVGFPIPIVFALMVNAVRSNKIRKFTQTVTYMPHFISTVVMVGMILRVFDTRFGIYAIVYKWLYPTASVPNILLDSTAFPHLYIWSGIWQHLGWNTVIYTAALSSVDPTQHEAATIDGASRFQRILHVDVPAIMPTITIMLILRCGSIMEIGFDKTYLMQNNGNLQTSEVISTYVYKVGLGSSNMDFSYGTAIGFFNSMIGMLMLVLTNTVSRRLNQSSLW
jgi:putative aldouronate transport system permease protein